MPDQISHPDRDNGSEQDPSRNFAEKLSLPAGEKNTQLPRYAALAIEKIDDAQARAAVEALRDTVISVMNRLEIEAPPSGLRSFLPELATELDKITPHALKPGVGDAVEALVLVLTNPGAPDTEGYTRDSYAPSRVSRPLQFPANSHNLDNGALLVARFDLHDYGMDVSKGQKLEIVWDGEYVRCQSFTWSVSQLEDEIDQGVWAVETEHRDPPST